MDCAFRTRSLWFAGKQLFVVVGLATLGAQDAQQPVFKAGTTVLQVDAVVVDRKGRQVTGLSAADFEILENGRTRAVEYCSYIPLTEPPAPRVSPFHDARLSAAELKRTFVFVISSPVLHILGPADSAMLSGDAMYGNQLAAEFVSKFVEREMRAGDLVEIVKVDQQMGILAQLTNDRELLREAIAKFRSRPLNSGPPVPIIVESREAALSPLMQQNLGVIKVMETAVEQVRTLPGRKSIVLAARYMIPRTNRSQGQTVADAISKLTTRANQAGVTIHVIALYRVGQWAESPLYQISRETGGILVENTNDPSEGMEKILELNHGYYLLGYRMDSDAETAMARKIHVRVRSKGLKVQARSAGRLPDAIQADQPLRTEKEMYAALHSPLALRDIGVTARAAATPATGGNFEIRADVAIDLSRFQLESQSGKRSFSIEVLSVLFGPSGEVVSGARRTHQIGIDNEAQFRADPRMVRQYTWQVEKTGQYQARFLIRDPKTGLAGNAAAITAAEPRVKEASGAAVRNRR